MRGALSLCLAGALAASAADPLETLVELHRTLDLGLWNARIEALYQAGELRRDGLPLLRYASEDADWQVRLTAVHFLGKTGPDAAPILASLIKEEACPNVRISALRFLSSLGEQGEPYFSSVLTSEDKRLMEEKPDRYGAENMGKPLAIDTPNGMTREFFEGGLDLRVCASSEHSGHRDAAWDPGGVAREDPFAEADSTAAALAAASRPVEHAASGWPGAPQSSLGIPGLPSRPGVAPPETSVPELKRPNAELDLLVAPGQTQTLAPGAKNPARPESTLAPGGPADIPDRKIPSATVTPPMTGKKESLPPVPMLPEREKAPPPDARIVRDAGTGKVETDTIPVLIAKLSSPDAPQRALVADILGNRGAKAEPAVPALRKALKDPDRRVRASAALALGNMRTSGEGVAEDLQRAAKDKNEDVRFSAQLALGRIASKR